MQPNQIVKNIIRYFMYIKRLKREGKLLRQFFEKKNTKN